MLILAACGNQSVEVPVPIEIAKQIELDVIRGYPGATKDDIAMTIKGLRATTIELNDDGIAELRVVATEGGRAPMCGNGHCAAWFYRNTGQRYALILSTGDYVEQIRTRTNGYRDLAGQGDTYHFDGSCYRLVGAPQEKRSEDCNYLAVLRNGPV